MLADRVAHAKHRDVVVVVPTAMHEQAGRFVGDHQMFVDVQKRYFSRAVRIDCLKHETVLARRRIRGEDALKLASRWPPFPKKS
jgi:hypothetical protein